MLSPILGPSDPGTVTQPAKLAQGNNAVEVVVPAGHDAPPAEPTNIPTNPLRAEV